MSTQPIPSWRLAAAFAALIFCAHGAPKPDAPRLDVHYIPRQDLARQAGESKSGVFLPLSDLLQLAAQARKPLPRASAKRPVECESIALAGELAENGSARLRGQIVFRALSEGWAAAPIDSSDAFWTSQRSSPPGRAFLARVDGTTYLYARGPASGTIEAEAWLRAPFEQQKAALTFGPFFAPSRIELALPASVRLEASSAATTRWESGREESGRLFVWPTMDAATELRFKHKPAQGPAARMARFERAISAAGGGLDVSDSLDLYGRFEKGTTLELPLPEGMRLATASADGPFDLSAGEGRLRIAALRESERLQIRAQFAAHMQGDSASLGRWALPAESIQGEIALRPDERRAPMLESPPASLAPSEASAGEIRYSCWGAMPDLRVALAPLEPALPPEARIFIEIEQGEARAECRIKIRNPAAGSLAFAIPEGWLLADLQAARQGAMAPVSIQRKDARRWRIEWRTERPIDEARFTLARHGAWGTPGEEADLPLPIVEFLDAPPAILEIGAAWPGSIQAREAGLSGLAAAPLAETGLGQAFPDRAAQLALRASSASPAGALRIIGRKSDVRATVVQALSIDEERAKTRAQIRYEIGHAPARTFRFALPPGIGEAVRIEGGNIRETQLERQAGGDIWTVIAREAALGLFAVTVEWTLAEKPGLDAIDCPAIRPLDIAGSQGFIALEASAALRLTPETANLAEADLADMPPTPWQWENRVLAVYRYIEPPFALRVAAEKFEPEPGLDGLATEARLVSSLAAGGERFTLAEYSLAPVGERQFLEIGLPRGAQVWSMLVDGEGVKPSRLPGGDEAVRLLAPLPPRSARAGGSRVAVLYREAGPPLDEARKIQIARPTLGHIPVNRTEWILNLPPGFECLAMRSQTDERWEASAEPILRFLRKAHYPAQILFPGASMSKIWGWAFLLLLAAGGVVFLKFAINKAASRRAAKQEQAASADHAEPAPSPEPEGEAALPRKTFFGLGRIAELIVVFGVILILALMAVPNFLEAQIRSQVSRAKSDMRSVATGIESYYVDWNVYPPNLEVLWLGPVKYLTTAQYDVFAGGGGERYSSAGRPYRYLVGPESARAILDAAPDADPQLMQWMRDYAYWVLYSLGPDEKDDLALIEYDPTNGTASRGDIVRTKDGTGFSHKARFREVSKREESAAIGEEAKAAGGYGGYAAAESESLGDRRRLSSSLDASSLAATAPAAAPAALPSPMPQYAPAQTTLGETMALYADRADKPSSPDEKKDMRTERPASEAAPAPGGGMAFDEAGRIVAGAELRYAETPRRQAPSRLDEARGVSTANGPFIAGRDSDRDWYSAADAFGKEIGGPASGPKSGGYAAYGYGGGAGAPALERMAGLLSLDIEIPEGGKRLDWQALGPPEPLELRLMTEEGYRRMRFCAWLFAASALGWVWARRRRAYRKAFLWTLIAALALPMAFRTNWAGLFNAAAGGALLSLALPCAARLIRRFGSSAAGAAMILALAANPAGSAQAAGPPAPARALVPYDGDFDPAALDDAAAFIHKDDFERLWKAAHPDPKQADAPLSAFVADWRLEGALAANRSAVEGSLWLRAANPADQPTSISIALGEMAFENMRLIPDGPALAPGESGCRLLMPAGWIGSLETSFTLPCKTQGASGELEFCAPEAGAGQWSLALPFGNSRAFDAQGREFPIRRLSGGAIAEGAAQGGALHIAWAPADAGRAAAVPIGQTFRARMDMQVAWLRLAAGEWTASLALAAESGARLPDSISLELPEGLALRRIDGLELRGSTWTADHAEIRLHPVSQAALHLAGYLAAAEGDSAWTVSPPRFGDAFAAEYSLNLQIANAIEVQSIDSGALRRAPAGASDEHVSQYRFEAESDDWRVRLRLSRAAAAFRAVVHELLAFEAGLLRRKTTIALEPAGAPIGLVELEIAPGERIAQLEGQGVARWTQNGPAAIVSFAPPLAAKTELRLETLSPAPESLADWAPGLTRVPRAAKIERSLGILPPFDHELLDLDLDGAEPAAEPAALQAETNAPPMLQQAIAPRSAKAIWHRLPGESSAPRFALRPIQPAARETAYSLATLAEGRVSLRADLTILPTRGRPRETSALLALSRPDPGAADRLQAVGPIRDVRTEAISDSLLRVTVEFQEPLAGAATIRFSLDQRADTDGTEPIAAPAIMPERAAGARAFLLMRRAFEGEWQAADLAGATPADPARVSWPDKDAYRSRPSDLAFELKADSRRAPAVALTRHARDRELRALIEFMRQRSILTADGFERHELELVVQNQSEQFLKLVLPRKRETIEIHEIRIAGRLVKPVFRQEDGQDALLVPLIRTGLLEPEATVRVVYSAQTGDKFGGSGKRVYAMPRVLGGAPVAESAMVLMLPREYRYDDFEGSMKRAELTDLEVDEAMRESKRIEKISEAVLLAEG